MTERKAFVDPPLDMSAKEEEHAVMAAGDKEKDAAPALAILNRYLAGELHREAVLLELTAPIERTFQNQDQEKEEGSAEMWLWEMWGALMCVVRRIAYDDPAQDVLVQLLLTMKEVHMPANSASPPSIWGAKFWHDLPILGPAVREDWNFGPRYPFIPSEAQRDRDPCYTGKQWASMNAFLARLSSTRVREFHVYGIWTMRETFEEPLDNLGLDNHVPAAATWVLKAGYLLFELAVEAQPPDGIYNAANGGSLWAGRTWYNLERWAFWKQGFNAVMSQAELHSWTKEMATNANRMMEHIEQQTSH